MKYSLEELLPIVTKLSEKYTSKESTSVTYETAEQLMEAIIYCLEEEGISQQHTIVDLSGTEPAEIAYQKGYERVLIKTAEAKKVFDEISLNFHFYRNHAYYDTIVKGMPAFFLYYDVRFNPQNHLLTLDYPTIKPLGDLCGIDAIYEYLNNIRYEQIFLNAFPENYILEVLEHYHNDYEELIINICEIVMQNVMMHMIVKKQITDKGSEKENQEIIKGFISGKSREKLEEELAELLQILIDSEYKENAELFNYLKWNMKDFACALINGRVIY